MCKSKWITISDDGVVGKNQWKMIEYCWSTRYSIAKHALMTHPWIFNRECGFEGKGEGEEEEEERGTDDTAGEGRRQWPSRIWETWMILDNDRIIVGVSGWVPKEELPLLAIRRRWSLWIAREWHIFVQPRRISWLDRRGDDLFGLGLSNQGVLVMMDSVMPWAIATKPVDISPSRGGVEGGDTWEPVWDAVVREMIDVSGSDFNVGSGSIVSSLSSIPNGAMFSIFFWELSLISP